MPIRDMSHDHSLVRSFSNFFSFSFRFALFFISKIFSANLDVKTYKKLSLNFLFFTKQSSTATTAAAYIWNFDNTLDKCRMCRYVSSNNCRVDRTSWRRSSIFHFMCVQLHLPLMPSSPSTPTAKYVCHLTSDSIKSNPMESKDSMRWFHSLKLTISIA